MLVTPSLRRGALGSRSLDSRLTCFEILRFIRIQVDGEIALKIILFGVVVGVFLIFIHDRLLLLACRVVRDGLALSIFK